MPPKLVCLESYWDDELFQTLSVRPFLEGLRPVLDPSLQIAHRFVESRRGLAHYARYPDGLLWKVAESWDSPVYYLAFHGSPGGLAAVLDAVGADTLCGAFRDFGHCGHRVLIYFGAWSVFRGRAGEKFAKAFLRQSGCHALIGYSRDIDWMESLVTDLLFLERFYKNRDPWTHLEEIFDSVVKDFPSARKFGYRLLINRERPERTA